MVQKNIYFLLISRIISVNIRRINMHDPSEVTIFLDRISAGDGQAPEQFLPLVYNELRKLAHSYLNNERPDHTLQPTALVHEAYISLINWENVSWQNRNHFFSVAAKAMRNILVDYARRKNSEFRGGSFERVTLSDGIAFTKMPDIDLVDLDEALNDLAYLNERQCKIVELRFFGGLTIEETAASLEISEMTVKRDWHFSKA